MLSKSMSNKKDVLTKIFLVQNFYCNIDLFWGHLACLKMLFKSMSNKKDVLTMIFLVTNFHCNIDVF